MFEAPATVEELDSILESQGKGDWYQSLSEEEQVSVREQMLKNYGLDDGDDRDRFAKSGCGANTPGGGGFQPGNTCAGDGSDGPSTKGSIDNFISSWEEGKSRPISSINTSLRDNGLPEISGYDPLIHANETDHHYSLKPLIVNVDVLGPGYIVDYAKQHEYTRGILKDGLESPMERGEDDDVDVDSDLYIIQEYSKNKYGVYNRTLHMLDDVGWTIDDLTEHRHDDIADHIREEILQLTKAIDKAPALSGKAVLYSGTQMEHIDDNLWKGAIDGVMQRSTIFAGQLSNEFRAATRFADTYFDDEYERIDWLRSENVQEAMPLLSMKINELLDEGHISGEVFARSLKKEAMSTARKRFKEDERNIRKILKDMSGELLGREMKHASFLSTSADETTAKSFSSENDWYKTRGTTEFGFTEEAEMRGKLADVLTERIEARGIGNVAIGDNVFDNGSELLSYWTGLGEKVNKSSVRTNFRIKGAKKGLVMDGMNPEHADENEVLLRPGTKFEIKSVGQTMDFKVDAQEGDVVDMFVIKGIEVELDDSLQFPRLTLDLDIEVEVVDEDE
tara:strand:+ start:128 stop:1819 length:1692 start_codon:yes stop_codon:yes gene_type:complete